MQHCWLCNDNVKDTITEEMLTASFKLVTSCAISADFSFSLYIPAMFADMNISKMFLGCSSEDHTALFSLHKYVVSWNLTEDLKRKKKCGMFVLVIFTGCNHLIRQVSNKNIMFPKMWAWCYFWNMRSQWHEDLIQCILS